MSEARKTLEERAQMSDIDRLRHSCAHVMATAILRLWPNAQFAYGPPVENGFYYDFDLPDHRITPDDFEKIEAEMKKISKENQKFEWKGISRDEAKAMAESGRLGGLSERPGNPSVFKLDLIDKIPEGEQISCFKNGDFIDLCAGPHVMRTGNVKPGGIKMLRVASAYFRGNEKNPQLQRLYGTAFKNKEELDNWLALQEEAKKRDHRKIGAEMGLFAFDAEYVGPGLALWLPKGAVLVEELEKLAKETEFLAGYVRVKTPHLAKEKMYKTSGHLPYYAESMFPPIELVESGDLERVASLKNSIINCEQVMHEEVGAGRSETALPLDDRRVKLEQELEGLVERYYLKAMNCPHHHRIFAAEPRSYRDLPLRLAEYGTNYRYEQSGELFGLMRVRAMNMNDAHLYCTAEQFADEFRAVNEMYLKYFKIFGIEKYVMRFSTHDPARLGQKFVNEPELWKKTEDMVRNVLIESGINYVEVPNEAAFYGPKIDVQVWSAIGREFTIATNQVDFAVPAKFGLVYKDRDNALKTPLCIHRAPLGTHERFIGFLIEHYAGNFPLWLAPEQVRVLTLNDDPALVDYAKAITADLRSQFVRVEGDYSADPVKAKISDAEHAKVHTMLVLGGRDLESGQVSVRLHSKGPQGAKPRAEAVADILAAIKERRA